MCCRPLPSLAILCFLLACTESAPDPTWTGTVDTLADTITVTTTAGTTSGLPPLAVDSVDILWKSDSLANTVGITTVAGVLAVADRDRIFVISPDGDLLRVLGRPGDGPGEYRAIIGIGSSGDTLFVWDARHYTLTAWAGADTLAGSWKLMGRTGPLYHQLGPVQVYGGKLTALVAVSYVPGESIISMVMRQRVSDGSVDSIAAMRGEAYTLTGDRVLVPTQLFGPESNYTVGPGDVVAWADGVEYCVNTLSGDAPLLRICREWERVPVTDAIRHPDLEQLDASGMGQYRAAIEAMAGTSDPGTARNSIDELRYDDRSRLWLRVVDSLQADIHPHLLQMEAAARPPHYQWDVFDTTGKLARTVMLPSRFDPQAFSNDTIYGFYELESGEMVVGRAVASLQ